MAVILLVEDDINLREIYAARLSAEEYEVIVASDGEEALAKSVSSKPELILLDVMMPKISGFDVLDILRSTPETKHTKVIMLTALSENVDRERGEKLGVNRYLIKSQITLEDVVENVKNLLAEPSVSDAANSEIPDDEVEDKKSTPDIKIVKKQDFLKPQPVTSSADDDDDDKKEDSTDAIV